MQATTDLLKRSGTPGWVICLGTVVVWDVVAIRRRQIETLSEAAWRLWRHPLGRTLLFGAATALLSHICLEPFWWEKENDRVEGPQPGR